MLVAYITNAFPHEPQVASVHMNDYIWVKCERLHVSKAAAAKHKNTQFVHTFKVTSEQVYK